MGKNRDVFRDFMVAFQAAHTSVYKQYAVIEKVPVKDVLDVLIEAAYANLVNAVKAKLIMEGKITNHVGIKLPKDWIREQDMAAAEILGVMGRELAVLDSKYEYTVGMMKRERKTKNL